MGRTRITIRDVADKAGVSIATVSNVFSGRKPVNEELRERVQAAARELAYEVDRAASQLRSGRARVVGMLVPDLDDVFFTSLISRMEVKAERDGYDIIVASSRDSVDVEASRLRALLAWRLAGLIAVPCSDAVPALLEREIAHLPMVFADRVLPGPGPVDTVSIDNREAGAIAARHLLTCGHREIVLAASDLSISPIRERIAGASEAIRAQTGRDATVVALGSNAERGAEIFTGWLASNARPSAVFALTNVTTLAALSALGRLQLEVPGQISLVGFDDYPWMSARKVGLTAIRQPIDEIATIAWDQLRRRMAGDEAPPVATVLEASLQIRHSVSTLPGRSPVRRKGDPARVASPAGRRSGSKAAVH